MEKNNLKSNDILNHFKKKGGGGVIIAGLKGAETIVKNNLKSNDILNYFSLRK